MEVPIPDDLGVMKQEYFQDFWRHFTPDDMWIVPDARHLEHGQLITDQDGKVWQVWDWPEGGFIFG